MSYEFCPLYVRSRHKFKSCLLRLMGYLFYPFISRGNSISQIHFPDINICYRKCVPREIPYMFTHSVLDNHSSAFHLLLLLAFTNIAIETKPAADLGS